MRSTRLIRCLPWISAVLLMASCSGQVMGHPGILPGQAPGHEPIHHPPVHHATAAPQATSAPQPTVATGVVKGPALPPSLMDKPAQPAKVTLDGGLLTIHANNSSLSAILQQLTSSAGMSVDGFQQDQRVFGIYGPGNPRDVLSGLLQGAGYNFLMVGTTKQGTPQEIVLTARSGGAVTGSPAQPEPDETADEDDNGDNSVPPPPPQPPMVQRPEPIPGASTAPQQNPEGRVKTPAEIIQELQRLRQQQQNPQ